MTNRQIYAWRHIYSMPSWNNCLITCRGRCQFSLFLNLCSILSLTFNLSREGQEIDLAYDKLLTNPWHWNHLNLSVLYCWTEDENRLHAIWNLCLKEIRSICTHVPVGLKPTYIYYLWALYNCAQENNKMYARKCTYTH